MKELLFCVLFPVARRWEWRGAKRRAVNFLSVTSTNVGISPQNFLTFSFNTFVILV